MTALAPWLLLVFVAGLAVGWLLNRCIARLPYEKSLIWPGSRCDSCRQPIRWRDQVPVLGYLLLRGKCRTCGGAIAWRYPVVELGTGLAFVALFWAEVVANTIRLPLLNSSQGVPTEAVIVFCHHAVLLSFLIVASVCDLMDMEIPLPLTMTGTFVGLILAALLPWPLPEPIPNQVYATSYLPPYPGAYAWPVWYPLPDWLPPSSWRLGLATGLAGALCGMVLLRGVRFLFGLGRGIEGLGVGDADLMMMAGAFVGWQPVVLAFFVSVFPALVFAVATLILKGEQALPFAPSLALGVVITVLFWPAIAPHFALFFFDAVLLSALAITCAGALLAISFLLRLTRSTPSGGGS